MLRIYTFHGPNNTQACGTSKEHAYAKWIEHIQTLPNAALILRTVTTEVYSFIDVEVDK